MDIKGKSKDIDYILEEIVGGLGWYQWRFLIFYIPIWLVESLPLLVHVYGAYTPQHRCFIEECDNNNTFTSLNEDFFNFTIPRGKKSEVFSKANKFDSCQQFIPTQLTTNFRDLQSFETCSSNQFDETAIEPCSKFIYDQSQMYETLATRLDLVCDKGYKTSLLNTVLMLGLMVGSPISGYFGDKYGRKLTMFAGFAITVPNVIIGGLVANYYVYVITRFISAAMLPVIWFSSNNHRLEFFSIPNRKLAASIFEPPLPMFLFTLIVHLTRHWTYLHLAIGIIYICVFPLWFLLPESPRWLAGNNRKDEAEIVLLDMAKINGKDLTPQHRIEIHEILENVHLETETSLSPLCLFKKKELFKTLILMCCWIMVIMCFYLLSISSVKLAGDIVKNLLLSTLADIPSFIILYFTLDTIGRPKLLAFSLLLTSISCVSIAFLPKDYSTLILICFMTGKFGASFGISMVFILTTELYPTNVRNQAFGVFSTTVRVFGLGIGFLTKLSIYWAPLPMLILAIPAFIFGCLALFLPETSGKSLPQTLKEIEE